MAVPTDTPSPTPTSRPSDTPAPTMTPGETPSLTDTGVPTATFTAIQGGPSATPAISLTRGAAVADSRPWASRVRPLLGFGVLLLIVGFIAGMRLARRG
ncbi:MAG: hypothetical protein H5T69_06520 [Chloroflexi bacterium]|nr:hypothetical protein [Chloroflexota bacterium]